MLRLSVFDWVCLVCAIVCLWLFPSVSFLLFFVLWAKLPEINLNEWMNFHSLMRAVRRNKWLDGVSLSSCLEAARCVRVWRGTEWASEWVSDWRRRMSGTAAGNSAAAVQIGRRPAESDALSDKYTRRRLRLTPVVLTRRDLSAACDKEITTWPHRSVASFYQRHLTLTASRLLDVFQLHSPA